MHHRHRVQPRFVLLRATLLSGLVLAGCAQPATQPPGPTTNQPATAPTSAAAVPPAVAASTWLLPTIPPTVDDAPSRAAIAAIIRLRPAEAIAALEAAAPKATNPPNPADPAAGARRAYLHALALTLQGKYREGIAATSGGLNRQFPADYVRAVLLRSILFSRTGDPMSAHVNALQAPPVAAEAFGDGHPATTVSRAILAGAAADAFARPQSLDMALGLLSEANGKLATAEKALKGAPTPDDFGARALLYDAFGDVYLLRKDFARAARFYTTAIRNVRGLQLPDGRPTIEQRLHGIYRGLDEDRLAGRLAIATAYGGDLENAKKIQTAAFGLAYRLDGLDRARWLAEAVMPRARALGDCAVVESLTDPGLPGRDGQQVRSLLLREAGTCRMVVDKDPQRAQPLLDAATACANGSAGCPR